MTKFEVIEIAGRFIVGRKYLKTRGTKGKVVSGIKFVADVVGDKVKVAWAARNEVVAEKAKSYVRRSDAVKLLNKICPTD